MVTAISARFPSQLRRTTLVETGDFVLIEKSNEAGVEVRYILGEELKPLSGRLPTWQPDTQYIINEAVVYEGLIYRSLINFISSDTFNPANWEALGGEDVDVPVVSVFDRVGAVRAEAGDYSGSLVTNDSNVAGETVSDALSTNDSRLDSLDASQSTQDGRLDGLDASQAIQDGRLDTIDAEQAVQDERLDELEKVDTPLVLRGGWDVSTNTVNGDPFNTELVKDQAPNADGGDPLGYSYLVSVGGEFDLTDLPGTETWSVGDYAVWTGNTWVQLLTNAVVSVFGRTGIVVATEGDYRASQVENDSIVRGAFVDDALDALEQEKATRLEATAMTAADFFALAEKRIRDNVGSGVYEGLGGVTNA